MKQQPTTLCAICGAPFDNDHGMISKIGLPICENESNDLIDYNHIHHDFPGFRVWAVMGSGPQLLAYEGDSESMAHLAAAVATLRGYQTRFVDHRHDPIIV